MNRPLRAEERALAAALRALCQAWTMAGLHKRGYEYRGPADFALREGEWWQPRVTDLPQGAPRMCFGNAITLAGARGFRYIEGYATNTLASGIPVAHAWNADDDGNLIDVTWGVWLDGIQIALPPGAAYLGTEFCVERADDATWEGEANVLDDWKREWPILREKWQGEDLEREWPRTPRLEMYRLHREGKQAEAFELFQAIEAEL